MKFGKCLEFVNSIQVPLFNNCTVTIYFQQKQVGDMEGEMKEMQKELAAMKQNRQALEHQNKAVCYNIVRATLLSVKLKVKLL